MDFSLTPLEQLSRFVNFESQARDGDCLKPVAACDLLVQAAEGKHQTIVLEHNELRIRKVPEFLAKWLCRHLNDLLQFPDIYFARRKDPSIRFQNHPSRRKHFDDVVLKFAPSQSLKSLVQHIFGTSTNQFSSLDPPPFPTQVGYAPFANYTYEDVLSHVEFWGHNQEARHYASQDVEYTRQLWEAFEKPLPGDLNSTLACMVGAVRWRGFQIDIPAVNNFSNECADIMGRSPLDPTRARNFIEEVMDEDDRRLIKVSTKKQVLEDLIESFTGTPVAERASSVLRGRQAKYNHDMCRKLITANRFHAAATVIGSLSGRKSGRGGDFNSQGISKHKKVRSLFTFARPGEMLSGGDFESFEVAIADGFFNDPVLRSDLQAGRSIHAIFGTFCFPGNSYEDILATKGQVEDLYKKAKTGFFLTLYGGQPETYKRRLNISLPVAEQAYQRFCERYKVVGEKRKTIFDAYEMLSQPKGTGTKVFCEDPELTYVDSMLGFRRSFEPEFAVIRAIHHFTGTLPEELYEYDNVYGRVQRGKHFQEPSGAVQSALHAASFGIQGSIQRAANNHKIQSTGAGVCKELEAAIWSLQPPGFHPWIVAPLNMHDEIVVAHAPHVAGRLQATVNEQIERFREIIPLLAMGWKQNLSNWSEI
jgi:hypothetical protein